MFNIYNFFRENSYITDWIGFGALLINIIVSLRIIKRVQRFQSKKVIDISGDYVSILSTDDKYSHETHSLTSIVQRQKDVSFDINLVDEQTKEQVTLNAAGMIDENKIIFGRLFKGIHHEKDDLGLFRLEVFQDDALVGSMYIEDHHKKVSEKQLMTLYRRLNTLDTHMISGMEYETSYQKEISKRVGPLYIKHAKLGSNNYKRFIMKHPSTHQKLGLVIYEIIDTKTQGFEDYFENMFTNPSDRPDMLKDISRAIVIHLIFWYKPYDMFSMDHLAIKHVLDVESKLETPFVLILREKIDPQTPSDIRYKDYALPLGFTDKKRSTKPLHDLETSGMTCPICKDVNCSCYTMNYFMLHQTSKKVKK